MKKKLTKSRDNVVLTGTLAGIAEHFGIDPTIIRIIYVFVSLVGIGSPILLYIVMAVLIPADQSSGSSDHRQDNKYYRNNTYGKQRKDRPRKEAEKVEEEDWSDF